MREHSQAVGDAECRRSRDSGESFTVVPLRAALFLAALLLLAIGGGTAEARQTRLYEGELSSAGTPNGFLGLNSAVVRTDTGKLLLVDSNGAPDGGAAIDRFSASGEYESQITGADNRSGILRVNGITVDRSKTAHEGRIYGYYGQNNEYFALLPSGEIDDRFGDEGHLVSPDPELNFAGFAVDPRNGNLAIASISRSNRAFVYFFDPSGSFLGRLTLPLGYKFATNPVIDAAGNLYVDATRGAINEVVRLKPLRGIEYAEPEAVTALPASSPSQTKLGVDIRSRELFVGLEGQVKEFDKDLDLSSEFGEGVVGSYAEPLPVGPDKVYVREGNQVFVFGPQVIAPNATTGPVADLGKTSVTLLGVVDPDGGPPADCAFEWGTSTSYGNEVGCSPAGPYTDPTEVETALNGLESGTTYHYRLRATNENGKTFGSDRTFTTTNAPTLTAVEAFGQTPTTISLGGEIDPGGLATTYHFEFGPTPGYGTTVPIPDGELAAGDAPVRVAGVVNGLQPGSTYHFRLVASNALGTVASPDIEVRTPSDASPAADRCANASIRAEQGATRIGDCRAWELVSLPLARESLVLPPLTGANSSVMSRSPLASPDGDRLVYSVYYGTPGTYGQNDPPTFVSQRSPAGWTSTFVGGPSVAGATYVSSLKLISYGRSLDFFNWETLGINLTPGASPTESPLHGVYGRALGESNFTLLSAQLSESALGLASSADGRHTVFQAVAETSPGVTTGALYVNTASGPEIVSILPDGSIGGESPLIDDDGNEVLFRAYNPATSIYEVFLRIRDRAETIAIGPGYEQFLTPKGDAVIFASGEKENGEDEDAGEDIYRYDVASRSVRLLSGAAPGAADSGQREDCASTFAFGCPAKLITVSEDGSTAFFLSPERLAPGAVADQPNLYMARDGAPRLIATLGPEDTQPFYSDARGEVGYLAGRGHRPLTSTPDGSAVAFVSTENLTTYDAGGQQQIYLFDGRTGQIQCASCAAGAALGPRQPSYLRTPRGPLGQSSIINIGGSNITADGGMVFFNTAAKLDPTDTNEAQDVYRFDAATGEVALISSGRPGSGSFYQDSSADGRDVFFSTTDTLESRDEGGEYIKAYDARVEGGFAGAPTAPECVGSACRVVTGSSAPRRPRTEGGEGGTGKPRTLKLRLKKPSRKALERAARTGRLQIELFASREGRVNVQAFARFGRSAKRVAARSARVRTNKNVVTLRLQRRVRKRLEGGGAVQIKVLVTADQTKARISFKLGDGR